MSNAFLEQQLVVLTGICAVIGVALMTAALFLLHHPGVPPIMPVIFSFGGLFFLVCSSLIVLFRLLLRRR